MPGKSNSWKRAKIFNHLSFSTLYFEQRIEFFLECLKNYDLNLDILESLFRGLLEIYSRVLFILNATEDEAVKKIIWQDLYLIGLSDIRIINDMDVKKTLELDYNILKAIGIEMPPIKSIHKNVQSRLRGEGFDNNLMKKVDQNKFPSVRQILDKYHNEREAPNIPKYFLHLYYSQLSEQLHGNFLMERVNPDHDSKYRLVVFLILFTIKFLKTISKKTHSESRIDPLIEEFEGFRSEYLKLWRPFQFS